MALQAVAVIESQVDTGLVTAAEPREPIAVRLLGTFSVATAQRRLPLAAAANRLVAFLAFSPVERSRAHTAAVLWPDVSEERAAANLRTILWRCKQVIPGLIEATPAHLRLGSDVAVDLREAEVAVRRLLDRTSGLPRAADGLRGLLATLSVDVLPDWDEAWVMLERERFRQLRLHALETFCERLSAAGHHAPAVEAALAAVAGEPLRESAHRALIKAHLAEGNAGEALRQYRTYDQLARKELGVDPSPQLQRLLWPD